MKRLVLGSLALAAMISGPVIAADMPVKAKARPVVVAAYDWSGFYIGGGVGGVWAEAHRFMPDLPLVGVPPTTFTSRTTDLIYNAHAGVQGQWGRWVLGVEGAYNASRRDMRSDVSVSPPEPFTTLSATTLITDLVTIGPRVGYTWDRLMVYGTGGYAGAHVDGRYTCTGTDQFLFPGRAPCGAIFGALQDRDFGGKTWNNGWFVGVGFDYVVHQGSFADILLGAEYQHFDLERKAAFVCNPVNCGPGLMHQTFFHDAQGDLARVRLSFKTHGWGIR